MNLNRISKLLRIAEARTKLEQSRLAALATAQQALLAEADALEASARTSLDAHEDLTAQALQSYGRRQENLERKADARRANAAALQDRKASQASALRASLRQEIAWESLSTAAQQERRNENNTREEERREALTQMRGPGRT